jgi:ferrochelatase
VRRFLREFLSDHRVIEIPRPVWWLILRILVLPFRPRRVAKLYAHIWQNGDSPMRSILREQSSKLERELQVIFPQADICVLPAMTYGQPGVAAALDKLRKDGVEKVVVLPLFPQFSATSTAPVYDVVNRWLASQRNLPAITLLKDYFAHPVYIAALAASVQIHQREHGRAEKLLFSFHGIPEAYEQKGDPYPSRCRETAARVAAALKLPDDTWAISFQSRFGKQQWVQPYTSVLLSEWAQAGVRSVQIMSPSFSADCLETLEELAEENREVFLHAGGEQYQYIPALNVRVDHIALFVALLKPHLEAHLHS